MTHTKLKMAITRTPHGLQVVFNHIAEIGGEWVTVNFATHCADGVSLIGLRFLRELARGAIYRTVKEKTETAKQ
jgi:hypothetical protein